VIYNLGIPGSDAYTVADHNRAAIAAASNGSTITLSAGNQFPFESPGNRFHVIPNFSVIYSCSGTALLRSTRAMAVNAAPLAACPAAGTVLVGNVDCNRSAFTYQAAEQRNGLLTMTLVLTKAGARSAETISLYQEVHLDNTP
jgi:hypothetical protein